MPIECCGIPPISQNISKSRFFDSAALRSEGWGTGLLWIGKGRKAKAGPSTSQAAKAPPLHRLTASVKDVRRQTVKDLHTLDSKGPGAPGTHFLVALASL
jgi:hypothetical protein